MANNSTLQKYKEFSIKYWYGQPARPWAIYRHSVIDELENLEIREAKRAYDLWNKSFSRCLDVLPRSKDHMIYYFYWDGGFNIIVITEKYKCGIRVIHSESEYDENIYSRLSFENKDGEKIDKTDDSINSFEIICKEIISLTDDEFDIFKPLLSSYNSVKGFLDLYYNQLAQKGDRYNRVWKMDGTIIWEKPSLTESDEKGWKI